MSVNISHAIPQHEQQPQPQPQPTRLPSRKQLWRWISVLLIVILSGLNGLSLRAERNVDGEIVKTHQGSPSTSPRSITTNGSLSSGLLLSAGEAGNHGSSRNHLEGADLLQDSGTINQDILEERNVKLELATIAGVPSSYDNKDDEQQQAVLKAPTNKNERILKWDTALQQTTKLLYRDSAPETLDYWLSQQSPKIYIYDTIPGDFSNVETISHCIDSTFLGSNNTYVLDMWLGRKKNCLWKPQVCQDATSPNKPKQRMFVGYRYNYNMDVAYLDKFQHRYSHQTKDPTEADLFLVPYPHKSHCLCHKNFQHYSAKCAVPFHDIEVNVLSKLPFFKNSNKDSALLLLPHAKERHIFFHGADWLQEVKGFREATSQSITLSLGPVLPCAEDPDRSCGHIALPYLITDPDYQPHLPSDPKSELLLWNSSAQRPFFVGAALSAPKGLALREQFLKKWKTWIGESVGGKPHEIIHMGIRRSGKKPTSEEFMDLYRNSTVCLILPGDGCAQKRFFDALLNGCIPLVPLFPSNEKDNAPYSFHHDKGCSTRITYPFAKGSFFQDPSAGFNIMDMVATFNGTCGLACLRVALEELVSNETVIQEKRRKLRDYASVVRFGLNHDSDGYVDVFSSLIVSLRHHVWHVLGRTTTMTTTPPAM